MRLLWATHTKPGRAYFFEDRNNLACVWARSMGRPCRPATGGHTGKAKQAAFLLEHRFPWRLVERIGVPQAACPRPCGQYPMRRIGVGRRSKSAPTGVTKIRGT